MNKFLSDSSGNILVLSAIFLPILMAFFLLIIDGGTMNIKTAELQTISASAAEYGLSLVSDKIVELAEAHCAPNCQNKNPVSYLDEKDHQYLISSAFCETIKSKVKNFILSHNQTSHLAGKQIEIIYPYKHETPVKKIMMYVSLQDNVETYFTNLFSKNNQFVKKETAALLPLTS